MDCAQYRELLSASLDDELDADQDDEVQAHLRRCAGCRRWYDRAAHVTRLARITPAQPGPDLTDRILAQVPTRGRAPARLPHWALGVAGIIQGGWGALALVVGGQPHHDGEQVYGAAIGHLSRESAAFTIALGVAFVWTAVRPRHASGLLPVLATFTVVLLGAGVVDLAQGHVEPQREAAHLLTVLGLVLVVWLARARPAPPGPASRTTGPGDLGEPPLTPQPAGGDTMAAPPRSRPGGRRAHHGAA